jgi:hypothetical protein
MTMDKKHKDDIIGIITFILSLLVIVSSYFHSWMRLWIYYKPFYSIFKNSFYLPFYLHIGGFLAFFALLIIAAIAVWKDKEKANVIGKIDVSLFVIAYLFIGREIYQDIIFISKENYLTIECDASTVKEIRHRRYYTYEILSAEKTHENKYFYLEMDFYQYNQLKEKYSENRTEIITVWYLPNTKRILRYE